MWKSKVGIPAWHTMTTASCGRHRPHSAGGQRNIQDIESLHWARPCFPKNDY